MRGAGTTQTGGWWAIFNLFVFGLAVVALGDAIGKMSGAPVQADFGMAWVLVLVAYYPIIAIHEFGHAIIARLVGWRVPLISIRGCAIWTEKFQFRYGHPVFPGLGGGAFVVPPRKQEWREWRQSYVILLLGGALANFALAWPAGYIAESLVGAPFWSRYLGVISTLSVVTGCINLLPIRLRGGLRTDGALAWDALRGEDLQPWEHEVRLFEDLVALKRPRDWNLSCVLDVQADADAGRGRGGGNILLFKYHLDWGDAPAARLALDRAEEKFGALDGIKLLRVYFLAHVVGDAAGGRALMNSLQRPSRAVKRLPEYWRARAAADIAESNFAEAADSLRRAHAELERSPLATVFDFELLERMEAISLSTSQAAPVAP